MADRKHQQRPDPVIVVTPWYPSPAHTTSGLFVRDQAQLASHTRSVAIIHVERLDRRGPATSLSDVVTDDLTGEIPTVRVGFRTAPPGVSLAVQTKAIAAAISRLAAGPVVLHAHVYRTGAATVLAARRRFPIVVTEHWSGATDLGNGRERALAALAYGGSSTVTAPSRFLADRLPVRRPVEVVPNPIQDAFFATPRKRAPVPSVLAVGNLNPEKRHDRLLEAFRLVLSRVPEARLTLAGDGPLRAELEARARSFPEGAVQFSGHVDRSDVRELLSRTWILAVSSDVETFSMITAEALASGVPVVSTRCGGPEELVGPETGIVTERSARSLAWGIADGLEDRERWSAGTLRHSVAHLAPSGVAATWESVYRNVGSRHRGRALLRSAGSRGW